MKSSFTTRGLTLASTKLSRLNTRTRQTPLPPEWLSLTRVSPDNMGYSRNESCICGSALRFKHCCGRIGGPYDGRPATWPAEKSLLQLVLEADQTGLEAGEVPKERALKNIFRIAHAIKPSGGTILVGPSAPDYMKRASELIDRLYRPADIGMGALHVGAIMFRDIFARIDIPISYGKAEIDALEQTDLTPVQRQWLLSSSAEYMRFLAGCGKTLPQIACDLIL
jgi:hypothetical protein